MWVVLFALCLLDTTSSVSVVTRCSEGPDYWCMDETKARECGAISYCQLEKRLHVTDKVKFEPAAELSKITPEVVPDASPVTVTLYFESFCPGCKSAILTEIYPTWQRLASSGILKVEFVPFGNAQERPYGSSYIYYCQHGPGECLGNKLESCAIHLNPDQNKYVPFIHCMEYYGPTEANVAYCSSIARINAQQITSCAQGALGTSVEHEMALKTRALNPPHQFVPWLTLNGQHTYAIQEQLLSNMLAYVCNAYQGTKPQACLRTTPDVCYKNEE